MGAIEKGECGKGEECGECGEIEALFYLFPLFSFLNIVVRLRENGFSEAFVFQEKIPLRGSILLGPTNGISLSMHA